MPSCRTSYRASGLHFLRIVAIRQRPITGLGRCRIPQRALSSTSSRIRTSYAEGTERSLETLLTDLGSPQTTSHLKHHSQASPFIQLKKSACPVLLDLSSLAGLRGFPVDGNRLKPQVSLPYGRDQRYGEYRSRPADPQNVHDTSRPPPVQYRIQHAKSPRLWLKSLQGT